MSTDSSYLNSVRESEEAVSTIADRDDRLGAFARVALALARDDRPDPEDLDAAGLPRHSGGDGGDR